MQPYDFLHTVLQLFVMRPRIENVADQESSSMFSLLLDPYLIVAFGESVKSKIAINILLL